MKTLHPLALIIVLSTMSFVPFVCYEHRHQHSRQRPVHRITRSRCKSVQIPVQFERPVRFDLFTGEFTEEKRLEYKKLLNAGAQVIAVFDSLLLRPDSLRNRELAESLLSILDK